MGGKKKKSTIGHRYFMGVHMALGRGPYDEIVGIRVGDKTAWQGSITGNTEVYINKPDLFGGEEKEGGIQGALAVLMGGPTQPVHARLASMLGGLVPAFRGVVTVFYDGLICAMSPYPKPWAFRVRRTLQGWHGGVAWYADKARVVLGGGAVHAMNPAHILYQVFTDPRMGRGLASARLDDASWRAAADVFYAEGMGLCLKWSRQDDIDKFAQTVLDHAGATFYTSRRTGLVVLKPIRDDYNVADLPHFTYDNGLLGVDEDESASQTGGVNEVIVKFRDPVTKQDRQVRAKNLGAIHAAGGVTNTSTKDFFGIPTVDLAQRVAERERRAGGGFVRKFKLRFDRRGADIMPGSVFAISDAKRGIARMVLRAGRCEYGTLTEGTVTITAVQDIFGLHGTAYVQPEPPGYTAPSTEPVTTTLRRVFEAPYRELVQQLGAAEAQAQDPTAGMLMVAAVAPTAMAMAYEVASRVAPAEFSTAAIDGAYCPSALLATGIAPGTTAVQLVGGNGLGEVRVGTAALLGEEIVRVDAINPLTGLCTFGRGCVDTVPVAHAEGTRIWFYDDFSAAAEVEYTQGVQVQTKVLTRTGSGILDMAIAPFDTTAVQGRAAKPYPPGQLRINGQAWPATITGELTVSWAHRDRIIQSDELIDANAASVGTGAGLTYRLRIYTGATLRRTYSGLTGTSKTYSTADETADGGPFTSLRIVLDCEQGGKYSHQAVAWEVSRA